MFKNCQRINTMGLSASLDDYIYKKILHKHENFIKIVKMKQKNQGIYPMGLCAPWDDYFINNLKIIKT